MIGLATGVVLATTGISSAFAATTINISDNGRNSRNEVSVRHDMMTRIQQNNNSDVRNSIGISSNTGNNSARDNHGDVNVRSGDSITSVEVHNMMNSNHLSTGCCDGTDRDNDGGMNHDWDTMMGRKLTSSLSGTKEVPGPGDPDGTGWATVKVHPAKGHLCVAMDVNNIDQATAAHIHKGTVGVKGSVVINLPVPNASGDANSCVTADMTLLKAIKNNPSEYYVNVHNTAYPDGAVRGQLSH